MSEKIMAETAKQGGWAKFMHWYESYKGKTVVNCIYSLGASVVIIGALFKIMHFPGAGPVLMTGMITEAFLFMIGCLEKPHPEFHWGNVFPQLLEYGTKPELLEWAESAPKPTLLGAGVAEGTTKNADGTKKVNAPQLTDADMDSLKEGITGLAKTATQLQELGKVATASNKLEEKMTAAGEAAEQFVVAGKTINEKTQVLGTAYTAVADSMKKIASDSEACGKQVEGIGTNLSNLNAVYELQIKALQAQVDAYKAQTQQVSAATEKVNNVTTTVEKIGTLTEQAMKSYEEYEAGAKKLAKQITDLNKVYGNMLNALA